MNEAAFVIGVGNMAGTAWLMGAYPWCMDLSYDQDFLRDGGEII